MKIASLLSATLLAACALRAEEKAPAACCAPAAPAPKKEASCCAAPAPAAAPFTAKSLYQLDATWTNDVGQPVTLAALRGKPVVLAMFFASCEYACPVLVSDLQRMRALLPEATRAETQFVLVTFDVARDTVEALRAYRTRSALDAAHWTLLRGDTGAVQELAMLLGVKYKQDARGQFSHSNVFTILNAEGEIVHQHAGLMGDVSEAAKAVAALTR